MKIGIDIRCLIGEEKTGVEFYALDIAKEIIKQNPNEDFVFFINSFRKNKLFLRNINKQKNVKIKNFKFPNRLLNLSFWLFGKPYLDKLLGDLDIFFMPNFSFYGLSKKCKLMVTVHDLSFAKIPWTYCWKRKIWHFLVNPRKIMQKAEKILAVSQTTKDDCVNFFKIPQDKIQVINPKFNFALYNHQNKNIKKIITNLKLPTEYLLYLGTIEPRKNIFSIIQAFEKIKEEKKFKNLYLVIAGRKGWLYKNFFNYIEKSNFKKYIKYIGYVKNKEKMLLYKQALIFIYPSFFEGFGFPPLEAMACQKPTVASNQTSIPEILKNNALLIDPYRPEEIFLAIKNLLENKKNYKNYSQKSYQRVKKLIEEKRDLKIKNLIKK